MASYDVVYKIRSLIKDLDAELVQLNHQYSVRKYLVNPNIMTGSSYMQRDSINSLLKRAGSKTLSTTWQSLQPLNVHTRQLRLMYRSRVMDAYRNRQIFTVYGNYHTVRRALLNRGWLEKLPPTRYANLQALTEEALLEQARRGNDYEAVMLSKMINHFPAFFIWQSKAQRDLFPEAKPYRNRVRRSPLLDFSTKVGLIGCAEQEAWYCEDGVCRMNYPRFYRLGGGHNEDHSVFIDDYHNTQARSLLRWVKEHRPQELIDQENGTVMSTTLDFAIKKVQKLVQSLEHGSLDDTSAKSATPAEIVENRTFMLQSGEVLKKGAKFKITEPAMIEYARLAEMYLNQIEELRPDFRWDGNRNLWILKPGYQSRGIGIVIRSSLDGILGWTSNNPNRKYVVQKYIERPMLVYRTKFDIRQYMLLTIGEDKVTVWTYRDCYLRFSSQEFTMDDLRESIHLTNNSVQKRYRNTTTRDERLPRNNMWSLDQFKCHLRHIGAPENTWDKIYQGFKQNLVAVVRASLDETELVQNAFELYGCDFMLDEQYNPILIEINSTPDLSPSTNVTARICPTALKDCIRVVVDFPKNPAASTGLFERAFEMTYDAVTKQQSLKGLNINGNQLPIHDTTKRNAKEGARVVRKILANTLSNKLGQTKAKVKFVKKAKKPVLNAQSALIGQSTTNGVNSVSRVNTLNEQSLLIGKSTTRSRPASHPRFTSGCAVIKTNEKTVLDSKTRENLALKYTPPQ